MRSEFGFEVGKERDKEGNRKKIDKDEFNKKKEQRTAVDERDAGTIRKQQIQREKGEARKLWESEEWEGGGGSQ